jgi:hypothetical protein
MWPIAGSKLAQGLCTLGYPVAPVSSFINKESRSETLKHYQALKMSRKLANLPACMENRPSLNGCVLWNNKRDILRANWLTVSFCEVHSLLSKDFFVFQGANFVNSIEILELTIETWFPDFFSVGNLVSPTEENHNFWMEDMIGLSELRLISKTRKNATTSEQFTYEKAKMCIERLTKLFRDLTDKDSARKVPKIVLYEPPKTARL